MATGRAKTAEQDRRDFENLVNSLESWIIKQTVLRMDELPAEDMRSPTRRQATADEINRDSEAMIQDVLASILHNWLGRPQLKPIPGIPALLLPPYANLSPRQREAKTRGEHRRPLPSFFLHTGKLQREQLPALLENLRLHLTKDHIRVYRVTARVLAVPTTRRNGELHYRSQTMNIDASGRGTKAQITQGWTIDMVLPPLYTQRMGPGAFTRSNAPEKFLTEDDELLNKLQNRGQGSSRPYRPLLGPYLDWFREQVLPARLRKRYSAKR